MFVQTIAGFVVVSYSTLRYRSFFGGGFMGLYVDLTALFETLATLNEYLKIFAELAYEKNPRS